MAFSRQSVDQEHAEGLHWRHTTLASPSGASCSKKINSGMECWCHPGLCCQGLRPVQFSGEHPEERCHHNVPLLKRLDVSRRNWLTEINSKSQNSTLSVFKFFYYQLFLFPFTFFLLSFRPSPDGHDLYVFPIVCVLPEEGWINRKLAAKDVHYWCQ